uniref:Odorant receptor n=1 Tax=Mythimna separata TaxID=271217 RepID=B5MEJ4_MYTSE|nr:olfactory receptor-1 [Mythimna separata]
MAYTPRSLRDFLFDYEPPEGVSSPADYAYLIMMRHLLSVISSWPLKILDPLDTGAIQRRKIWVSIQRFFHMAVCLSTVVGGVMYVMLHKKSMTFFELGHLYISLLMTFVIFSRISTLCFSDEYVVVARNFLEKFHLFFYKDRSEYSMQTHKQVHRIAHLFTIYLINQMLAGLFLFNVTPMYNNYSAGNYASGGLKGNATYEHALYFSYPFNASGDLKWYILANIFHWIISYLCATWFCMHDCFLSLMVFHIWGHFKILLYNLENFPRPANRISFIPDNSNTTLTYEMYTQNEQKNVGVKLGELINYHRDIISFTDKMSEVFGPMLFAYYGFHQASGCLLLLECSQMTAAALTRYLPLTIILFQQLIQLSIIFELIGSISDRLKFAVYGLPWESMDKKNRRTVAFFLMNVQEPVHVKALGLADVGVTSMTAILKTSFSYFTFLKSM